MRYLQLKKMVLPMLLGCLPVIVGCSQRPQVAAASEEPYFDVPGLIEQQLYWLDLLNPSVVLNTQVGTHTETATMKKDSTAWAETLQLFQKSDINRPVLRGVYEETDSLVAGQETLRVKTYRATKSNQAETPFLKIYYYDSLTNVHRIETAFREDNVLYSTHRTMWMTFSPYQGQPRLEAFETTGKQKMMLRDSVIYVARGTVQYD